jgi:hypothetical protein
MATSELTILDDRFLETRAAQLAAVLLTRHRDVSVEIEPVGTGRGLDLLVSLLEGGRDLGRLLGVEVQAVRPRARPRSLEQALRETNRLRHIVPPQIQFPVCLFVFTMDDDHGYWRWLRAPGERSQELTTSRDSALCPLTDAAAAGLLAAARDWYGQTP